MAKINDIREVKKELRAKYRGIRENMHPIEKHGYDLEIKNRLLSSSLYKDAKVLLCFVSTNLEIDTIAIIEQGFKDSKTVAVPKCTDEKGNMDFFIIESFDDLEKSTFSLLEPDIKKCKRLINYSDSIAILPGFAFDKDGYRIGFGKGYYDRFLNKYTGKKVAICYNKCIVSKLPRGKYDVAADYIITQKYILTTRKLNKRELTT